MSDLRDPIALRARVRELEAEVAGLRKVIETHDLCHNLHGQVDARAFADGCAQEQRQLFGCAPDADAVALAGPYHCPACWGRGDHGTCSESWEAVRSDSGASCAACGGSGKVYVRPAGPGS